MCDIHDANLAQCRHERRSIGISQLMSGDFRARASQFPPRAEYGYAGASVNANRCFTHRGAETDLGCVKNCPLRQENLLLLSFLSLPANIRADLDGAEKLDDTIEFLRFLLFHDGIDSGGNACAGENANALAMGDLWTFHAAGSYLANESQLAWGTSNIFRMNSVAVHCRTVGRGEVSVGIYIVAKATA